MDLQNYKNIREQLNFNRPISKLLIHFCGDLLLWSSYGILVYESNWWSLAFSQILLTIFFFRAFGVLHDSAHELLSSSRLVNKWVGIVYGTFCFLPYSGWKDIHLKHHIWSSNVDKDPTAALIKNYNPKQKFKNNFLSLIWKSWFPILGVLQFWVFWKHNFKLLKNTKNFSQFWMNFMSIVVPILIYTSIFYGARSVVSLATVIPALFMYFMLIELINFPHHLGLPTQKGTQKLEYRNQHLISRSCYYPKVIAHNILLNFNYHIEHHLYPDLPWHQLAHARNLIKPVLGGHYNNVKGNVWIVENRKLNLGEVLHAETPAKDKHKAA